MNTKSTQLFSALLTFFVGIACSFAGAIATIGENAYETLADAFAAAQDGETIAMAADEVTIPALITFTDKALTLDLDGRTVEATVSAGKGIQVDAGAKLTVSNGRIDFTNGLSSARAFNVDKGGELTVAADATVSAVDICALVRQNSKLTLNGTFIETDSVSYNNSGYDGAAIQGNGKDTQTSTTIVINGTILAEGTCIYHPQVGDLTINEDAVLVGASAIAMKGGSLTVNGGTLVGNGPFAMPVNGQGSGVEDTGAAIYIEDNYSPSVSVAILGGTIISENGYAVCEGCKAADKTAAVVEISGGDFTGAEDKAAIYAAADEVFEVSGGTFSAEPDPSYLADNFVVVSGGERFGLVPVVAKIGDAAFETLSDALAAAVDDDTIVLTADVTLATACTIADGRSLTLDLNGFNVTLNNGNIGVTHGALAVTGEGTFGGTADGSKALWAKGSTDPMAEDYSVLTVGEDVTVTCSNGYAIMVSANNGCAYGVKINVAGTVIGAYGALYTNGKIQQTEGNVAEITVAGTAKLSSSDEAAAVYAAGYAKWFFLDGCSLTGGSAVYANGGDIKVYGGSFHGIREKTAYAHQGSGYEPTGDAFVAENSTGYAPLAVQILDGSFVSDNADAVGAYAYNKEEPEEFISGGTFSSMPDQDLLAFGLLAVADGDVFVLEEAPATVGTRSYSSFPEALAAAVDGDTILLHADYAPMSTIEVEKDLTIDLNGHSIDGADWTFISGKGNSLVAIRRGAMLTVTDSSASGDGVITTGTNSGYRSLYAAIGLMLFGDSSFGDTTGFVMNGGTVEGWYYGVLGNGARHNTSIVVNGGCIAGLNPIDSTGIYHPQLGTIEIHGGTVCGATGVAMKSGSLVMDGGEVAAFGNENLPKEGYSHGINLAGAAIQMESSLDYYGGMTLEVTGGALLSENGYAVYEYIGKGSESAVVSAEVFGGEVCGAVCVSERLAECEAVALAGGDYMYDVNEAFVPFGKTADSTPFGTREIVAGFDPASPFASAQANAVENWANGAGRGPKEMLSVADVKTTEKAYEAYVFNQVYDCFAEADPDLVIDSISMDTVAKDGSVALEFEVRAGETAVSIAQINGAVSVKKSASLSDLNSVDDTLVSSENIDFTDGRAILRVLPPEGDCGFFRITVK